MIRSVLFWCAYWLLSAIYVITALPFVFWPQAGPVRAIIKSYTRAMTLALRVLAGVRKQVRGRANLPEGPFILAAKHQSWGDGFLVYPEVTRLSFVTGDHLEKLPFVGRILRKLGAIVIDTCGGGTRKAASLADGMQRAAREGRRVLIYPEGHLAPVGQHFRYKAGVWHMQKAMDVPVVPVATNLGVFWPQEAFRKRPGTAVIEFLEPIPPGLEKDTFLERLTEAVEAQTAFLVAEARGGAPVRSSLMADPRRGALPADTRETAPAP